MTAFTFLRSGLVLKSDGTDLRLSTALNPIFRKVFSNVISAVRQIRGARGWRPTWSAKPESWSTTGGLKGSLDSLIRCHGGFDSYCSPPFTPDVIAATDAEDEDFFSPQTVALPRYFDAFI